MVKNKYTSHFVAFLLMMIVLLGINVQVLSSTEIFKRGLDSVEFIGYAPLANKPVKLFSYIPAWGDITTMRVLFSFHGAERSGPTQINAWKDFADDYGFIVLAPQYESQYYSENEYQFGGVSSTSSSFSPKTSETWTYASVAALFQYFKMETGNVSERFDMFGHSAGGQFVHRYLLATPDAPVNTVVAANSGSWTFPDENFSYTWPYSVKATLFKDEAYLVPFFGRKLIVQLGTNDTVTSGNNLPTSNAAKAQGACRYEKGHNFFQSGINTAQTLACPLQWTIVDVQGVDHSSKKMVYGKNSNYQISDIPKTGAYSLLFENGENHFNSNMEWNLLGDSWHYNDTNLVGRSPGDIMLLSTNRNMSNDYVYSADLRFRKGVATLICCSPTADPTAGSYAIQLNLGSNTLRFFDFKDNYTFAAASIAIPEGNSRTYHIEVIANAPKITIKVNNVQYISLNVSSSRIYTNGYTGVGISNGTARFSNIYLRPHIDSAVGSVAYQPEIESVQYYNQMGQTVTENTAGILIRKTLYTDKSVKLEKTIK